MRDLYLLEHGCIIKKDGECFRVTKDGKKLIELPYTKVDKIFMFGSQSITPKAVKFALEKNKDIIFLERNGKIIGKIISNNSKNVFLRLAQYDLWSDKGRKLGLAKKFVIGKIINQNKIMVKNKNGISKIEFFIEKIKKSTSIDELMGYEGEFAKLYFSCFNSFLKCELQFKGRTRRPPKDEVNALLSLTYTLTGNYILCQLDKNGFDPNIGYLHSLKYGRESLALDVLEEFRPVFCDNFVVKILNRKEFKKLDFVSNEEGFKLTDVSIRKFFEKYNKELEKYKEDIDKQVLLLKKHIIGEAEYKNYI